MKKIALIPAYEPDLKMIDLIESLFIGGYDVVVVDDGSGAKYEGIFSLAGKKNATVISHSQNRGKGNAIKTGLFYICLNYNEPYVVVTADCDGQHTCEDIEKVTSMAADNMDKLILGGRRFEGKVPLRSRVGNSITRFVYRAACGAEIYDTQTGLRAFSHKLSPIMINIPGERYEYEMNMLMYFARQRLPMEEIPIKTVYIEENASSHFDTIKDSVRIYKEILKFSGVSFLSFLLDYMLYIVFLNLTGVLTISNIFARILSASFNYTMNRKLVFKSRAGLLRSITQYVALAVFILAANTAILAGLAYTGVNVYLGKVITEVVMFFVSYTIQHRFIFKKHGTAAQKALPGKVAI